MLIITSAAIQYKGSDGFLKMKVGRRHHEIIKQIHDDGDTESYLKNHVHGFIVTGKHDSMFIDTEEATELAELMNIPMRGGVLISEDLW